MDLFVYIPLLPARRPVRQGPPGFLDGHPLSAIGEKAFFWDIMLTDVAIPQGVGTIGEGAFIGCPDLALTVGRGSRAEAYCGLYELPFSYRDE